MANVNFTSSTLGNGLVTPAQSKVTLESAYLDIRNSGWAQQYLPDLYESEIERYGDRSISGFLAMVGAEMPMSSDQVIWSEQGRLHLAYKATINPTTGAVTAPKDIDNEAGSSIAMSVRVGQTVVCQVTQSANVVVLKGQVTAAAADGTTCTIKPYGYNNFVDHASLSGTSGLVIRFFVYGSDFKKGTTGLGGGVEAEFKSFQNKPMIIKDEFMINGSDAAAIGWVEVSGEAGQSGYLWYLKSSGDTEKRFDDYLEMSMMEAENVVGSGITGTGSEGLFAALENRGLVASAGMFDGASDDLADFDILLQELDKQGGIAENMMFLNREAALAVDNLLAGVNSHYAAGVNYGVFNNSEDMALNLGFNGFRRASYDFYKTDWKYLNNKSTRFLVNDGATAGKIEGVMVPAGTTTVYDENLGKNIRRPFLHVRYRASQADDRKLKKWTTGSVGAATSDLDAMKVHYLSERCIVTQGANNFVLFR